MGQFDGRVAFVTGGNDGIGRATAIKFAEHGAKVAIAARRVQQSEEVVREIENIGGEALFVQTDVAVPGDVKRAVEETVERFGHLDYAFNNAGTLIRGPLHETELTEWEQSIKVNLTGVWLCMKYEIRQMLTQGGGVIVNDSSAGGLRGANGGSAYSASKHGVVGLTKSAALEYAQRGIRTNAVCPGFIDTAMTKSFYGGTEGRDNISGNQPAGRHGMPDEIAEAVIWICSDAASFVNGVALPVDGGLLAK